MGKGMSNGKGRGRERYGKNSRMCVCMLVCVLANVSVCEFFLLQPVRAGGLTAQTNGPLN